MVLKNVYTVDSHSGEINKKASCLVFEFDEGKLIFECPLGASMSELAIILQKFSETLDTVIIDKRIIH
jgi:hypothetical protein